MNEAQINVTVIYAKNNVRAAASANVLISVDEGATQVCHQTQNIGVGGEAIDIGDVGILDQSILFLRNLSADKTVSITRSDADNAEYMLPGESFGPARMDGALLGHLRLGVPSGTADVEVLVFQAAVV